MSDVTTLDENLMICLYTRFLSHLYITVFLFNLPVSRLIVILRNITKKPLYSIEARLLSAGVSRVYSFFQVSFRNCLSSEVFVQGTEAELVYCISQVSNCVSLSSSLSLREILFVNVSFPISRRETRNNTVPSKSA